MGILLPLCYYQHSAGGTTNIAAVTINIPVMLVVNVASCPVMLVVRGAGRKPVFPLFPPAPPFLSYISLSLYLSTGAGVAPAKELPKSWATPCFACATY